MNRLLPILLWGFLLPATAGAVIFSGSAKVKTAPPLTGDGKTTPVGAVTNVPGGLVTLTSSGTIPAQIMESSIIQISTGLVTPVELTASNGTLGVGTTFYAFSIPNDILILKLTATLHEPGSSGATTWRCGDGVASNATVVTQGSYAVGSRTAATYGVEVSSGTEVSCLMESSTQEDTPTAVLGLLYIRK